MSYFQGISPKKFNVIFNKITHIFIRIAGNNWRAFDSFKVQVLQQTIIRVSVQEEHSVCFKIQIIYRVAQKVSYYHESSTNRIQTRY